MTQEIHRLSLHVTAGRDITDDMGLYKVWAINVDNAQLLVFPEEQPRGGQAPYLVPVELMADPRDPQRTAYLIGLNFNADALTLTQPEKKGATVLSKPIRSVEVSDGRNGYRANVTGVSTINGQTVIHTELKL